MRILFFSDFHFESKINNSGIKLKLQKPVANDPSIKLIKYLNERYINNKISFMVFLGDYVIGKNSFEDKGAAFDRIKEFIFKIENECKDIFYDCEDIKNRILILDGNHDVSRDEKHHDVFQEKFNDYLTPFTESQSEDLIKKRAPIYDFENLNTQIGCISTTGNAGAHFSEYYSPKILELIEPLKAVNSENYDKIIEVLKEEPSADVGSVTVDIIDSFIENVVENRKNKIICSHHPLIKMQHEISSHIETVNGSRFFDMARAKGFKYFVSGHLHEFYCADIFSRGKNSDLPNATIISVPSFITPDGNKQCFVDLDINDENYICKLLNLDEIRDRIEEIDIATNGCSESKTMRDEHILLDYEIEELIQKNNVIENASTDRVQAASYDCAIGLYYKRYDKKNKSWPENVAVMEKLQNGDGPATIKIKPGEKVLLYTHEKFNIPPDMFLQASPRASWNRRGIDVGLSFFVEPGFSGEFCFPVKNDNNHTIEISAQESIMSIVIHKLSSAAKNGWSERQPGSKDIRNKKQDR